MRLTIILLSLITTAAFLLGCRKPPTPTFRIVKRRPSGKRAVALKQPKAQEGEVEFLLKELKGKDPFQPDHLIGDAEKVSASGLKGIVWDTKQPFAIIGDTVVVEGDFINNKKVIKINKDSIILEKNGRKETLWLEE